MSAHSSQGGQMKEGGKVDIRNLEPGRVVVLKKATQAREMSLRKAYANCERRNFMNDMSQDSCSPMEQNPKPAVFTVTFVDITKMEVSYKAQVVAYSKEVAVSLAAQQVDMTIDEKTMYINIRRDFVMTR